MTFIIGIFKFHCKNEHKQVNWNGIKGNMCKSESTFPYLQLFLIYNVVEDLNDFWNLFFDKVYCKSKWKHFPRENLLHLISFRKC